MTKGVPSMSLNSTFHHVCTLVRRCSVCSLLFVHIIPPGYSVSGVPRSPLFPLRAFHFHPARKSLKVFSFCPTFEWKGNMRPQRPVAWWDSLRPSGACCPLRIYILLLAPRHCSLARWWLCALWDAAERLPVSLWHYQLHGNCSKV